MMAGSLSHLPGRKKLGWRKFLWLKPISTGVIIFLIVLLSIIIFSRVGHFHNGKSASSSSRVIDSACSKTSYPERCISTLLLYPNAERESDSKNFALMTVNVTLSQTHEAYRLALNLGPEDEDEDEDIALGLCKQLLLDSTFFLNDSVAEIARVGVLPSNAQIESIRAWLDEVVKNQDTCSKFLQDWSSTETAPLKERSHDLSKSTTNAMDLLNISFPETREESNTYTVGRGLLRVKQGNEISDERSPEWMLRVRNSGVLLANVTVAQDGSGHYKTITEAVHNAPSYSREPYVIFVKQGIYNENINVAVSKKKINLMLIGEGRTKTIVSSHRRFTDGSTTLPSPTSAAAGRGFIARDMTLVNSAGPSKNQAVAIVTS